jgi:hypothetical protein
MAKGGSGFGGGRPDFSRGRSGGGSRFGGSDHRSGNYGAGHSRGAPAPAPSRLAVQANDNWNASAPDVTTSSWGHADSGYNRGNTSNASSSGWGW